MRALYISHNGMLEGLGQAQVLPYLRGLAARGTEIDLLSYELPEADSNAIDALRRELACSGVTWTALRRSRDTRLVVKVNEALRGLGSAVATALVRRPDVVHGRSYLPTAMSDLIASALPRAKLVFDCRGMLGDEYVDAGHWTTTRLEYRLLKKYEARAFRRAEGVVVLTNALRDWIADRKWFGRDTRVEVIPCCVDLEKFRFDDASRERLRNELGFGDSLVVVYSGSLGPYYRHEDMARFAGILRQRSAKRVTFLVLSAAPTAELTDELRANGFPDADVSVRRVAPSDMPKYLSCADVALSFIKTCFSKKGSSPTKVAEYLATGIPVVLNGDIGDQAELATETRACVVMRSFDETGCVEAVDAVLSLATRPLEDRIRDCRRVAEARFGLDRGIETYQRLYRAIVAGPRNPAASIHPGAV